MSTDSPANMTGWARRDAVENTLTTGDAPKAQGLLNNVQDQRLFMDLLALKAQSDSLPGLHLVNDAQGHTHEIKTDQMTISDADGHLSAHANKQTWGQYFAAKWDGVTGFVSGAVGTASDAVGTTEIGQALKDSGTSKSLFNQGMDAREKQIMGNN